MDRKYLLTAFGYMMIGLVLGIYMAASKNHGQMVAHAHIMLLGFVVSFIYAVSIKLWSIPDSGMLTAQYYLHQLGSFVLLLCLFLMYGGYLEGKILGPFLGVSSLLVLTAAILMKIQLIKALKR